MEKNIFKKAKGKLASKDTKTFDKILDLIITNWDLNKPVDLMLANRMVTTFMKLQYVEKLLETKGLIVPIGDGDDYKISPLAYYANTLETELMRFYRVFQGKKATNMTDKPKDICAWLSVENKKDE